MTWDEMAVVGRIARTHGIRGQLIVNLETDFPEERFKVGAELFLGRSERDARKITLTAVRFHQGRPIVGISGVDDMNAATLLAGAELRVPVSALPALPDGTFYVHDLVGCQVELANGGVVGDVASVEGAGAESRLVIETAQGEVLVPLVTEICTTIDPVARRIIIAPPPGLIELNRKG